MKRYRFAIHESAFGASTSCIVEVNRNEVVMNVFDDSSHETNWVWDGWKDGFLESLIGKKISEVRNEMEELFDDWWDEYRNPHVIESEYWGTPDPSTRVEPALV